ncbi:solute carrier family 52, riboflavin transporter, member 2 isoform X1 [Colossoma macropomum]|uniref:solute carrier family 52, riboflavin transporter, member 2 isoform X1 n=1 Tax=Colossoma macropomum TaxID=42526 RepID=UPI001863A5D2|nr:solute carrier family 52, riboflavin transporter, member 2 isoform X1 [Colossoma macropomum]
MEDLQDSAFSGPTAMSLTTELKDDFYFKLVDDFLGPQTGDLLGPEEKPCTNRFLVQVGLMREENDVPWVNILKWLQKIFPKNESADFRCLIERNTETALSLTGDARKSFLESDVNFEFVGPICDSIGIGRRDLLEMSDFSDRAELTDVTNGLILELTSFIAREKIDPVVLVSWLRNFDPTFCSDGKIQKANKLLQASLKKFRIQYRNSQRSRNRSSGLFDEFLHSPFELVSDLDDLEYRRAAVVKGLWKRKQLRLTQEESNFQTLKIKEENEPFDISEDNASSGYGRSKDSYQAPHLIDVKEEYDPESIRSDPAQVQPLDLEENPPSDTGDCVTLLDTSFMSLQKLTELYGGKNETAKKVSMDLLKNQFSLMLREDLKMKSLNEKVTVHAVAEEDQPVLPPLSFLQCTTHFLFDVVDAVEKQIMSYEREIVNNTGDKLGRDNNPRFRSFVNFDESAVTRYIHMACEILCPREETSSSYRRHWLAFCIERNNPSTLPMNRSNRFMNYFEAAAGLVHHYKDVALFVSDLQQLNDDSNILLDSVSDDASDEAIQTLACVVAVVYCKVLGPFWQLLKSDAQYSLFSKYIFCLYEKLLEWSQDVSALLRPEPLINVFLQVPMQEKNFSGVFGFCQANADNQFGTLLKVCLQRMTQILAAVMEEDLKDFLPGGKYCKEPSPELVEQLSDCTFSQLMGEYPFGHTYSYNKKRPDKVHVQTEGSTPEDSARLPVASPQGKTTSPEVPSGPFMKRRTSKPYVMFERANLRPLERIKKKRLQLIDQRQKVQRQDQFYKKMIVAAVAKNGGPCKTVQDVDRLLTQMEGAHHAQKRAAIRCELTYQKFMAGSKEKKPEHIGFSLGDMVSKLKAILPSEKSAASLASAPTTNVVVHVGGDGNQSSDVAPDVSEPQEDPTNQPSQPLNIDVGNRGRQVVLQSYREKFFDEFAPIS